MLTIHPRLPLLGVIEFTVGASAGSTVNRLLPGDRLQIGIGDRTSHWPVAAPSRSTVQEIRDEDTTVTFVAVMVSAAPLQGDSCPGQETGT